MDHHTAGPTAHCAPHSPGERRNRPSGTQHRLYTAPHRAPAARPDGICPHQGVYRILRARHPRRPRRNAKPLRAHFGRRGLRHLVAGGHHVPTLPPPDMLRYGLHSDSDRMHRPAGRPRRRGRSGGRHHRARHARRNRLHGEFPRTRGSSQGPGCKRDAGNRRKPPDYRGRGPHDDRAQTCGLQDGHPLGRIHLLRRIPQAEIRIRLRLRQ